MHTNVGYQPEGHQDAELIEALEPDQLVATASKPFPLLRMGALARAGLWALRIFVLLITAILRW
jgi:hypothetical protein